VGVDAEQVRRVPAAGALDVVHVDRAVADGRKRVLTEPELVDRVGVQMDGEVVPVGRYERDVEHRWRGTEVLVDLDPERAPRDRFFHRPGIRAAAPEKAEVE